MNWYYLSLITLVCQGVKGFLYKVSAEKNCNSALTNFFWVLTVAIISAIFLIITEEKILNIQNLIILAFLGGGAYVVSTITRIEALKHAATSVVFPITRLSSIIIISFSLLYFRDALSVSQSAGIIISVLVAFIVTKQHGSEKSQSKNFTLGILLSLIAALFGAVATIVPKFAVISLGIFGYMFLTYLFQVLFSFIFIKKLGKNSNNNILISAKLGILMGFINMIGFYSFLRALEIGPLSIVFTVQSLSFVVTIVLSVIIYKEKITIRRIIGILFAVIAVILMKN